MERKIQSYDKRTFTDRRTEADYLACCWNPCRWKRLSADLGILRMSVSQLITGKSDGRAG